jgi:hypothetical protein
MIVAVVAVRVVQVAVDQIIDMIAVRYRLVAAVRAVLVALRMASALVVGRAAIGIGGADRHDMLIEMIFMRMMKVAVVKIVHMSLMPDSHVSAARPMLMRMVVMNAMRGSHDWLSFHCRKGMVPRGGIEPPTLRFSVACSTN